MAPISNRPGALDRLAHTPDGGAASESRGRGGEEHDDADLQTSPTAGSALARELQRARQGREGGQTAGDGEGPSFEHFLDPRALLGEAYRQGGEHGRGPGEKKVGDLGPAPLGDGYEPSATPERGAGQPGAPGQARRNDLHAQDQVVFTDPQRPPPGATRTRGEEAPRERERTPDEGPRSALNSAALLATTMKHSLQNGVSSAFARLANILNPQDHAPPSAGHGERSATKGSGPLRAPAAEAKLRTMMAEHRGQMAKGAGGQAAFDRLRDPGATPGTAREEVRRAEIAEDKPKDAAEPNAVRRPKEAKEGRDAKDLEQFLNGGGFEETHALDGADLWRAEHAAEEEAREKGGMRAEDVLGPQFRCHGTVEDGTRCLRKPTTGSSYCLEHLNRIVEPALEGLVDVGEMSEMGGLSALDGAGATESIRTSGFDEVTSPSVAAVEEVTSPGTPIAGSVITD